MIKKYPKNMPIIARKLKEHYGDFAHHNRKNPLDELLFIICSVKTTGNNYRIAYASLKAEFPSFKLLSKASQKAIAKSITYGGLYNSKSKAIKAMLGSIVSKFGKPTLAPLKRMSASECEKFLLSLPGVGKKVARCVMLYSLGHEVFPVDTHCWRISQRLGWVRPKLRYRYYSPGGMDKLQEKIPPRLRYSLHVNMVSLGKEICTYFKPKCAMCPVANHCPRTGAYLN